MYLILLSLLIFYLRSFHGNLSFLQLLPSFLSSLSLYILRAVPVLPHSVSLPNLFPFAISAFLYFLFLSFSFSLFHLSSFLFFSLLSSPLTFNFCFPFSISLFLHSSFPFSRSTQPLTQMSTKNIFRGGWRWPIRRSDNVTTFMCRLSWNLPASTSWNLWGVSSFIYRDCFNFYSSFLSAISYVYSYLLVSLRPHVTHHSHKTWQNRKFPKLIQSMSHPHIPSLRSIQIFSSRVPNAFFLKVSKAELYNYFYSCRMHYAICSNNLVPLCLNLIIFLLDIFVIISP